MTDEKERKIVRTPTMVSGGITPEEKARLDQHAAMWIDRIMRTDPIEPDRIIPAIEGLYAAAGLKKPKVIIVPSPLVMAAAGGLARAILVEKGREATFAATRVATHAETSEATDAATHAATDVATDWATSAATDWAAYAATYEVTREATREATRAETSVATTAATTAATRAATSVATTEAARAATSVATTVATTEATTAATVAGAWILNVALSFTNDGAVVDRMMESVRRWWESYSGGNMWGQYDSYLTAMRDVLGLRLPQHEAYAYWEQAAIHGGFRYMHPDFCMVSDFPEILKKDERNRAHCEDGPSHRWRDGWELYHWHGVRVDRRIVMEPESITVAEALAEQNADVRRVMFARIGGARLAAEMPTETIDESPDVSGHPRRLYRIKGVDDSLYIDLEDHIGQKHIARAVPPEVQTCDEAVAWRRGAIDYESGVKRVNWEYAPSVEG